MTKSEIGDLFRQLGVMSTGHFALTSGRHSGTYMQCAHLFVHPEHSERLCKQIAGRFEDDKIDMVVGPALGGVIMAHEMARMLGVRNVFAERQNGVMKLRRGFEFEKDSRVLVVEDVVTTGGSVMEVIELVKEAGAEVAGVAVIVDRSGGRIDFGCRLEALLTMEIESYLPEECPMCAKGLPIDRPGSRGAQS